MGEQYRAAIELLERKRAELIEREKLLKAKLEGLELAVRIVEETAGQIASVDANPDR